MCDRECICQMCINKPCGLCNFNEDLLNECRNGGIKECIHFRLSDRENNRDCEMIKEMEVFNE